MHIIRPDSLPRLWWLNPWGTARYLHSALVAVKRLADKQDDLMHAEQTRPRWSIWISGVPGPTRKYLFVDNDGKCEKRIEGIVYGTKAHFYNGAFTSFKDAEAAIMFCDDLNNREKPIK